MVSLMMLLVKAESKDISLEIKQAQLRINASYAIKICITNTTPIKTIGDPHPKPRNLSIECRILEKEENALVGLRLAYLSKEDIAILKNYKFDKNLVIFGGQWSSTKHGDLWEVRVYDLFEQKLLASRRISEAEYRKFLNGINNAVLIRNKILPTWKKLSQEAFRIGVSP